MLKRIFIISMSLLLLVGLSACNPFLNLANTEIMLASPQNQLRENPLILFEDGSMLTYEEGFLGNGYSVIQGANGHQTKITKNGGAKFFLLGHYLYELKGVTPEGTFRGEEYDLYRHNLNTGKSELILPRIGFNVYVLSDLSVLCSVGEENATYIFDEYGGNPVKICDGTYSMQGFQDTVLLYNGTKGKIGTYDPEKGYLPIIDLNDSGFSLRTCFMHGYDVCAILVDEDGQYYATMFDISTPEPLDFEICELVLLEDYIGKTRQTFYYKGWFANSLTYDNYLFETRKIELLKGYVASDLISVHILNDEYSLVRLQDTGEMYIFDGAVVIDNTLYPMQ